MVQVNIPYLVERRIRGKVYYTWQPGRHVRALGFRQKSFGTDRDRAITRSVELNAEVEAVRAKRDRPESS